MITLRCTKKLLKKFEIDDPGLPGESNNALGDWYADILYTRQGHYLICVSEKSLLPIVLSARDIGSFVPRFQREVFDVLKELGVSEEMAGMELDLMYPLSFGKTKSRVVLGSMNDFIRTLKYLLPIQYETHTCRDWSRNLGKTPCSPIGMRSPDTVTVEEIRRRYKKYN